VNAVAEVIVRMELDEVVETDEVDIETEPFV
jgi:hypothetical protein